MSLIILYLHKGENEPRITQPTEIQQDKTVADVVENIARQLNIIFIKLESKKEVQKATQQSSPYRWVVSASRDTVQGSTVESAAGGIRICIGERDERTIKEFLMRMLDF